MKHSFSTFKKWLTTIVMMGLLAACDSDDQTDTNLPVTTTPEVPEQTLVVSGIAAAGAALDGAMVEVIDGSGNVLDVGDVLTGSDGSYQVELPPNTALPVLIRVTPPGGEPLLNVIPLQEDGVEAIVANINPLTDLVAGAALGDTDANDNAALAGALAGVDTANYEASGDAIVQKLLGSNVQFSSFANDPDFVAKSEGEGAATPSASDAILDTLAKQSRNAGTDLKTQLRSLNEQEEPSRLLESPAFQVSLVGEMVKGGTAAEDLDASLSAVGALSEPEEGEADVFRSVIATVPTVIAAVRDQATGISDDADLLEVATDAAVDLLSGTIDEKQKRFGSDSQGLVNAMQSNSLQQTVVKVVNSSVVPVLTTFAGTGSDDAVKSGLQAVTRDITRQAVTVASAFQYSDDSTDVSDLVSGFVGQNVGPSAPLTPQDLADAASGTGNVVREVGDVNQAQSAIQTFAEENAGLVEGPLENVIDPVPTGTWDTSTWDNFNWG